MRRYSTSLCSLTMQLVPRACLDQAQILKSLHKEADSGACRSNHGRKLFVGNLKFDSDAARVFLAHLARQLQKSFTKAMFTVNGHQIGNHLLLIGTNGQPDIERIP